MGPRLRALVGLGIVALTGWWLGGFSVRTFDASGNGLYDNPVAAAPWLQAEQPAVRSYFRIAVPLEAAPTSAVLWIDAEQSFAVWANGHSLAANPTEHRTGVIPRVHAVDLTAAFASGTNEVGVQVTNHDAGVAAFRAHLTVHTAGGRIDLSTESPYWRATSDVTAVKPRSSLRSPSFSSPLFDDSQWSQARRAARVAHDDRATLPETVMERPAFGQVVTAPASPGDLVVRLAVPLPAASSDAWLRVAASGPFDVRVNGQQVAYQSQVADVMTAGGRSQGLFLYDLGSLLGSGGNTVAIHVSSLTVAAVYADVTSWSGSGMTSTATGAGTQATRLDGTPTAGLSVGSVESTWPHPLSKVVVRTGRALSLWLSLGEPLAIAAAVVAGWLLLAVLMARVAPLSALEAAGALAAAHLPVLVAVAALDRISLLTSVTPPFPYQPSVLASLVIVLIALEAGAALYVLGALRAVEAAARRVVATVRGALRTGARRPVTAAMAGVGAIAGVVTLFNAYRLDYEPLWQDEIASVVAGQSIRAHGLPRLPSSMLYLKGELYSVLLAVVGGVVNDGPVALRAINVLWYAATVLLFGLVLMPLVLPGRRLLHVAATLIFATAPVELVWARDVRMYQLAQFFAVIFVVLFLHALRGQSTRAIAGSAVALVAMYFSHEETFIFLPVIPIIFFATMRLRWVRDWRWWVFGGGALAAIGTQFLATELVRPAFFGYDLSNKPYVTLDTSQVFYYISNVYFPASTHGASLVAVSSLAVVAGIVGLRRRDFLRLYLSLFLWLPVVALSTVFSPKISRYAYVTLPILFALAALGALDIVGGLRWLLGQATDQRARAAAVALVGAMLIPGTVWVGATLTGGVHDYGVGAARLTGAEYSHRHADYNVVVNYMLTHQRPGDLYVTLGPAVISAYYAGRAPDYIIAPHPNRLLFLMLSGNRVVDTEYGTPTILTAGDLQRVVDAHRRVWIVTDQGQYFASVSREMQRMIAADFAVVAEGETTALYFRAD